MLRLVMRGLSRLRARPDREHEISINRLVISFGIAIYVLGFMPGSPDETFIARLIALTYFTSAVLLFGHLLIRPGVSVARRLVAIGVDLGLLSSGLHVGGEYVAILYPFYYWIILGNGFRYGLWYLFVATAVGAAGFVAVITTTDYWLNNQPLSIGLAAGVVALPLYASTLIRSLSQARDLAEQASQAKSLFLASVSHELRTPLNAVVGMADLLNASALRNEQREMVATIRSSSNALLSLIDDLLDLARIEAGKITLNPATFDLAKLLAEVRGLGTVQAGAKGLHFNLHVTPRTPLHLVGDERRLREVLINLVGNAVKFTQAGGVMVYADGVQDGDRVLVRFEVTDTGIGIAANALERIFDRFTQADETIMNRFGGTGLGLAISQQLVQLQGGQIEVASEPGKGSTFSFTLPFELSQESVEPATAFPDVEVIALGRFDETIPGWMNQLNGACSGVVIADNVDQVVWALKAPCPERVKHRIVLLVGPEGLSVGFDSTRFSNPSLEGGRPAGVFLVSDGEDTDLAVRMMVSAVLSRQNILNDFRQALHVARGGDNQAAAAQPQIRRRDISRRVLLADDNRVNQKVVGRILEAGGHQVTVVSDGEQALDMLETGAFDAVVMDINMPVMDGLEATKLFRMTSMGGRHVPIVGLTADATQAAQERALDAGMDACLTKPVNGALLLDRIDELCADAGPVAATEVELTTATRPSATVQPPSGGVDFAMLDNLKELGGAAFVEDVISTFLTDGAGILDELKAASGRGDVVAFSDRMHALQSIAGNVGMVGLAEQCRSWRPKSAGDLKSQGPALVANMAQEFEGSRALLLRRYSGGPVLVVDQGRGA